MRLPASAVAVVSLACAALSGRSDPAAHAESWCAYPLWVHEWGVHVFGADGLPVAAPALPAYFLGPARTHAAAPDARGPAVRTLPIDSGIRLLPVLDFYSAQSLSSPIPLGVEVGFVAGAASAWFPEADLVRAAGDANGPAAIAARLQLLALRQAPPFTAHGPVPPDPTRQLVWDRLELSRDPLHPPAATDVAWPLRERQFPSLWVNDAQSSERFVFYEAKTDERPLLSVTRASDYTPTRRHLELANVGADPVHDVFFTHDDGHGGGRFVVYAETIAANSHVDFVLEDHRVDAAHPFADLTLAKLTSALVDSAAPEPTKDFRWDMDHCVMQRNPAIPFERAEGHRLYRHEVQLLLDTWGTRFFGQPGTTLLYREDTALLDRVMPLSLYTDMYNYIVLRRLGLALWEHVRW